MEIAIIGSGALACAYASQLQRSGATVTLVSRERSSVELTLHVTRGALAPRTDLATLPVRKQLPPSVDVVLLCVRVEQVTEWLVSQLRQAQHVVLVVLTPVTAQLAQMLRSELGHVCLAMPSLLAHLEQDTLRLWVPPFSRTLIEPVAPGSSATAQLDELTRSLCTAGIASGLDESVGARNQATTVAFFPLQLTIACAPHIRGWRGQPRLLALLRHALRECGQLARQLGPVDAGIALLAAVLRIRLGQHVFSRLAPLFAPRLTAFLEHHFGPKLMLQHQVLAKETVRLGEVHGVELTAFRQLWCALETSANADISSAR